MNSYLADFLFSFYIITSNGGDLHTFPAFLNSQQERMSQEKKNNQTPTNQNKYQPTNPMLTNQDTTECKSQDKKKP